MSDPRTVMTYQPTHDWVVAKKHSVAAADSHVKIHGIVRVNAAVPHHFADVIAIGPGRANPQTGFTPALPCKPGDVVMVRHMAGDPEVIDGLEFHWFMPDEILAVVPPRLSVESAA